MNNNSSFARVLRLSSTDHLRDYAGDRDDAARNNSNNHNHHNHHRGGGGRRGVYGDAYGTDDAGEGRTETGGDRTAARAHHHHRHCHHHNHRRRHRQEREKTKQNQQQQSESEFDADDTDDNPHNFGFDSFDSFRSESDSDECSSSSSSSLSSSCDSDTEGGDALNSSFSSSCSCSSSCSSSSSSCESSDLSLSLAGGGEDEPMVAAASGSSKRKADKDDEYNITKNNNNSSSSVNKGGKGGSGEPYGFEDECSPFTYEDTNNESGTTGNMNTSNSNSNNMYNKSTNVQQQDGKVRYGREREGEGEATPNTMKNKRKRKHCHHRHHHCRHCRHGRHSRRPPPPPPRLKLHVNGHSDTTPLRRYWEACFRPEVYMKVFYALRITLLVGLPLGLLARHPNVFNNFPAHVVLPLWGVVDCRYTFGEQLAASIVSYQCGLWMMLWGGVNNAWGLLDNTAAWWCATLGSAFVMSLFGDVRCKRLVVLQSVMILQMENLPGGTELMYPVKVGRDMIMSTTFALLQSLFPPRSIAREADAMQAQGWKDLYNIVFHATHACWSRDPVHRALALRRMGTEPLQNLITALPPKLFFVMYEFWESTLRLELRRERLEVVKGTMAPLHALTDTARAIVLSRAARDAAAFDHRQRRHQLRRQRRQLEREEREQEREAAGYRHSSNNNTRSRRSSSNALGSPEPHQSRGREEEHQKQQRRGRTSSTLEAARLEEEARKEAARRRFDRHARGIIQPSVLRFLAALAHVTDDLGRHLNPRDVSEHVRFGELRAATHGLQAAVDKLHFVSLVDDVSQDFLDPFFYTNFIFFHVTLVTLAERLLQYGDSMSPAGFDRRRYKSAARRFVEFFFLDYWIPFWEELPKRLTLATPRDVRMFKDAIKMAGAYGVGVMFTEYTDPENIYYFGMAILMGVGWPTAGDTMVASVYRVAGMVFACSIAYIAVWHSNNLAGELALALVGLFISLLFRDVPVYSHTAQYCAMLIITALNSATTKLVLLARIVSNSFTVITYYAIVVFLFPIDVLRTTYQAEAAAAAAVCDRFSDLVLLLEAPLFPEDADERGAILARLEELTRRRVAMWAAVVAFGAWIPKAAAHPTTHGKPYPEAAMRNVFSSLRRLGSATDIICQSLCALHRAQGGGPYTMRMTDAGVAREESGKSGDVTDAMRHHRPPPPSHKVAAESSEGGEDTHDEEEEGGRRRQRQKSVAAAELELEAADRAIDADRRRQLVDVLAAIRPVLRQIDRRSRVVVQDFLTAHAAPHQWSAERATRHFSAFLQLSAALHESFLAAHRKNTELLRRHFRQKVLHRTLASAAAAAAAAAGGNGGNGGNGGGRDDTDAWSESGGEGGEAARAPSAAAAAAPLLQPGQLQMSFAAVSAAGRAREEEEEGEQGEVENGGGNSSSSSRSSHGTRGGGSSTTASPAAAGREGETTSGGGGGGLRAYTVADDIARYMMRSAPPSPAADGTDDRDDAGAPLAAASANTNASATFEELRGVLRPLELAAVRAEYRHFTRARKLEYELQHPSEFSVSRDANTLISILVAADIFFVEAERLLKTMYEVHAYAASREPPPDAGCMSLLAPRPQESARKGSKGGSKGGSKKRN